MDTVVYTAIFGKIRDHLYRPPETSTDSQAAFVAFTDKKGLATNQGWDVKVVERDEDPRRAARKLKVLSHDAWPGARYTLWVDGCLTPIEETWKLVDRFLNGSDLCVFEHMERGCIYQELEACIRMKKDAPHIMREQLRRYKQAGYPYHNGLAETTAVLRRETDRIKAFNQAWWAEIERGSVRDQLSFNYVAWQLGIEYTTFEGNRCKSPHFTWRPHR